ncbi:MAG: hypothetical protein ACRYF7_24635 [Janthinobacterium lividum]
MRAAPLLKQIATSAFLALVNTHAIAADPAPRILREPVLGLHYERARVKFDPMPPQALANCETLADNEYRRSVWYVYGQVRDASGRTFYVTGGHSEKLDGRPLHRKFSTEGSGWVLYHDAQSCEPYDAAREVFDEHVVDSVVTPAILKQLAADVVRRLERAFGGPEQLKLELRNQRVDLDALPPELRDAMKAYIVPSQAAGPIPRILREPVLGLRYERARVKFDPMPSLVLANCGEVLTDEFSKDVWYVHGQARDASGRTFYVTGGYQEMLDGRPKYRRFLTEEPGMMFYTDARTCQYIDPARIVFDEPDFKKVLTPPILKQLAADVVRRLERAFGGPEQLKLELRNQRVDLDALPPELRDAMKAYVGR